MAEGMLWLVSLGPGDAAHLTPAARQALRQAELVIGYAAYLTAIEPLLAPQQQRQPFALGEELVRAETALRAAAAGRRVALVSSGDIGVYGMAAPLLQCLERWPVAQRPAIEVVPGVSAVLAAAARLGAPLGHDWCCISLSDLLTPWSVIERRLRAAAAADFVIALFNPRSQTRTWQLATAQRLLLEQRPPGTPLAVVRAATRPDEQIERTTLAELQPERVDMLSLVLIGNSQSRWLERWLLTPRGYREEQP